MLSLRMISLIILLAHTWICLAQQACQPIFPGYRAPGPEKNDPKQVEGIWYSYRQFSNLGAEGILNARIKWVPIAQTVNTNTNTPAWAMWAEFTQWVMPENTTCTQHYWTGQYSEDGRMIGNPTAVEDNYVMREGDYAVLYHDYQKHLVGYGCYSRYTNGTCKTIEIFNMARKSPLEMTAADMDEYDQIINRIYAPYCISTAILPRIAHSAGKPYCDFLDPPGCTANNIQGSKWFSPTSSPAYGSGTGSVSTCQFPNSIGTQATIDPTKALGLWYGYRVNNPSGGSDTPSSLQYQWTSLGPATMPLTNSSAQLQWMEYAFINGTGCFNGYFVGAVGTNGQSDGLLGPIANTGDRITFRLTTMQLTDQFALYYGCVVPDTASANCRMPFILAGTRKKASQLSAADRSGYDSMVDAAFSKYGCSVAASDIKEVEPKDAPVPCAFQGGNDCINKHLQGLQEAVETDSSGTGTTVPPTTGGPGSTAGSGSTAGPVSTAGPGSTVMPTSGQPVIYG